MKTGDVMSSGDKGINTFPDNLRPRQECNRSFVMLLFLS